MDPQRNHLTLLLLFLTVSCLTTIVCARPSVDKVDQDVKSGQPEVQPVDVNNSSSSVETDNNKDRIGLTVNKAQAHAVGAYGGQSMSQATSYGLQVGIVRPGQGYQQLHSSTGGSSNSFSSGPGSPKTWAGSKSHVGGPGHLGGGGSSGFSGGRGTATSNSYTMVHKIHQYDGTILYSNLKNVTTLDEERVVEPGQTEEDVKKPTENDQLLFNTGDDGPTEVDKKEEKIEVAKGGADSFVFEKQ